MIVKLGVSGKLREPPEKLVNVEESENDTLSGSSDNMSVRTEMQFRDLVC